MMRRGKNLFCAGVALALCLGLTACGVQTSTEPSVAPYDMTEEQEDLLSLLGMTDRAMVFSFQSPEEATQLTAHTYVLEDGAWVENGEYPADWKALEKMVRGVCYNNAVEFFGFPLEKA